MRNVVVKKDSPFTRLYLLPPLVKALLALFLLVFICVVGFIYMHQRATTSQKNIDQRQKAAEQAALAEVKKYMTLAVLSGQAETNKKQYDKLILQFPPQSKVESLLESITKLGTAEGLKFIYFKPQKTELHDFYAALPIDIAILGRYHQIAKFLSGIANLPHSVVAVNRFFLAGTKEGPHEMLTFQFTATIYYAATPIASTTS